MLRSAFMASRLIRPIEQLSPRRAADFGGKAKGLALMARGAFPIPRAFAISAGAADAHFAKVLDEASLPEALIESGEYDDEKLEALRARVQNAELDPALDAALVKAVEELLREGDVLAVRSSGTLEDTEDYSAAGLHETILGIRSVDEVRAGIKKIWASLFAPRILTYLEAQHKHATPRMGVILQRMIEPRISGVFFTANPLTGDAGEIVVDASYGLGT